MGSYSDPSRDVRGAVIRTVAATTFALAFALGAYLLLQAARPETGVISFSFLLVLPAAVSAFVAYVADPWKDRLLRAYLMVPVWLLLAVILASLVVLREGVICVVILSPLWLGAGMVGSLITYRMRRRIKPDHGETFYCAIWLAAPLFVMQVEPFVAIPVDDVGVTRSIIVDAAPEKIWPLLRGIPDVRRGEGTWNVTQDLLGVPRPLGAQLVGEGIGAERLADWGENIKFRERITRWQPGRQIGWRFIFDDIEGWKFTDRHLMPDSPYFRVTTGGYDMKRLSDGRTLVALTTRFRIQTPVNLYTEFWGQLFLGDLENNLLALVKGRAER